MSSADDIDVLLVEDNPDDAEFTLRALRKAQDLYLEEFKRTSIGAAEFAAWGVADGTALFNPALPPRVPSPSRSGRVCG